MEELDVKTPGMEEGKQDGNGDLLLLDPKYFGPFWEYVENDDITDVDFNGTDLWITDTKNRRTKIRDHGITQDFVQAFSQRVANQVSKPFNKMNNLLEAETKTLRISILHESAAVSGRSICLRKTLPTVRMTARSMIDDGYMPQPIVNLLANCIKTKLNFVIGGEPGAGKDLSDGTFVPVPYSAKYPTGWARHGALTPGDQVYTPDGSIVSIDYVTKGRNLDLYEVEFSDGQVIKASDTHLWRVSTHKVRKAWGKTSVKNEQILEERDRILDLAYALADSQAVADAQELSNYIDAKPSTIRKFLQHISLPCVHTNGKPAWPVDEALAAWADHLVNGPMANMVTMSTKALSQCVIAPNGRLLWAVRAAEAIEGPDTDLPLDPYTFGAWLACGCPCNPRITVFDDEVLGRIAQAGYVRESDAPEAYFPRLWDRLCNTVQMVDFDKKKLEKRIPGLYRRASLAQRLALLQGLMDCNGFITKQGQCELCIMEKGLAEDALELVRSLGILARMETELVPIIGTDQTGAYYRILFITALPIFTVSYKAIRIPKKDDPMWHWNYIVAIRHVASEYGRCIHVVHPEHMYSVGGFIQTHNTECAKFFTQFVQKDQRVITIEDSPEWHFHTINPEHDCVEMRINPDFDYAKAIKTCLRQNPKWIMLSEARSVEVKYLIESWSTGVHGVTTIHTDDIRKIPSRLLNMMANRDDADRLENDIYDFVNVTMIVRRKEQLDGSAKRYIDQMGFLYRDGNENKVHMLIKNGEMVSDWIPRDIQFKLSRAGITKPFECEEIDKRLGETFTYTYMEKPKEAPQEKPAAEKPEPTVNPVLASDAAPGPVQEPIQADPPARSRMPLPSGRGPGLPGKPVVPPKGGPTKRPLPNKPIVKPMGTAMNRRVPHAVKPNS